MRQRASRGHSRTVGAAQIGASVRVPARSLQAVQTRCRSSAQHIAQIDAVRQHSQYTSNTVCAGAYSVVRCKGAQPQAEPQQTRIWRQVSSWRQGTSSRAASQVVAAATAHMGATGSRPSTPQPGCIFCSIAQRHATGNPGSRVLYDDPLVYVIKDIRPAAVEHLLVIPKGHIPNVNFLTGADVSLVRHMLQVGRQQLQQQLAAAAAGSTAASGGMQHASSHQQQPAAPAKQPLQQQQQQLLPLVDEAGVALAVPPDAGFKFGFHRPPFRSIDHLHLHCFVLPHRWYRWWQYQCSFNWVTAEDLIDSLTRLPS